MSTATVRGPNRETKWGNDLRQVKGNAHFGRGLLYPRVPKDLLENLDYRRWWMDYGLRSRAQGNDVAFLCRKDPLWYVNTFVWTFDPRKSPSKIPFITFDYQDEAFLEIINLIRGVQAARVKRRDERLIEKSRDMGATWVILTALEWFWHFERDMTFLLLSRKEEEVDDPADHKALFQKLDFIHNHLPGFLMPPTQRLSMRLKNLATGSSFSGESTNKNAGRGTRCTAALFDEFAAVENGAQINTATAHITYCRIFNSTVQGTHTEFSRLRASGIKKIRMHWSQHPEKNRNLYTSTEGKDGVYQLKVLEGDAVRNYKYILDGKLRSPWYDAECEKLPPDVIAQELDIDDAASQRQFFDAGMVDRLLVATAKPPVRIGTVEYDPARCRVRESMPFRDGEDGTMRLWTVLDEKEQPNRRHRYAIAADIATGTGASNSTLAIGDLTTREKIGEFASANIKPEAFARLCMAVGYWFKGLDGPAKFIWENNGPTGRIFGDEVLEHSYPNIYWGTNHKGPTRPEHAGWLSGKESRAAILADYRDALHSNAFAEPSKWCLEETRSYVYKGPDIVHSGSLQNDPSGAKANHGDRVIASCLLWLLMGGPVQTPQDADTEPAEGTFGHRQRAAESNKEDFW